MRMRNLFLLSIGLGLSGVAAQGADEIDRSGILPSEGSKPVGRYRTESVLAGEWQKVAYNFTVDPHGEPISVGFLCLGPGKAWFDDSSLREMP